MGYHSTGVLKLTDDEGGTTEYKVDTYGARLILTSEKGVWDYVSNKPAVLLSKLREQEDNLNNELRLIREAKEEIESRFKEVQER
jgi:hypothetical protein